MYISLLAREEEQEHDQHGDHPLEAAALAPGGPGLLELFTTFLFVFLLLFLFYYYF